MKNYKTIHDVLENWGKSKQKSPANNTALKDMILNKLPCNKIKWMKTPTPLPWLSFAFATMAVVVVIGSSIDHKIVSLPMATTQSSKGDYSTEIDTSSSNSFVRSKSVAQEYYPNPGSDYYAESPISDNREFLKTYYNSTLRTRHVAETKTKIEVIVRGFGGRVDGSNSSKHQGYISFAIPANKFEMFREEVKSLVGSKLYIENVSTENFLPQKQVIEEQQNQTEKYISGLKSERSQVISNHNQATASYQFRINTINTEIARFEIESQSSTPQRKTEISIRISELQAEKNIVQGQMGSENAQYQKRLTDLNGQLRNWEINLDGIKKQDKDLVENVATVTGSISLSWIGLWEVSDIYTPGPLLAWILLVVALVAYKWHRRYLEIII